MNKLVQVTDVSEFMRRHLVDVFDTMLAMKASPLPDTPLPAVKDRVSGSVGFAGETVHGAVYLHLPHSFARQAAAAMLGLALEEITSEAEVNDVVGELTNMLTGGLKSWLCDAGLPCAVSTPAIIRGEFDVEPMPDVARALMVFDCDATQVLAEIHIKLNPL